MSDYTIIKENIKQSDSFKIDKVVNTNKTTLSILTWNVLKNEFEKEITDSYKRYPYIIEQIKKQNADIICLQEVTKEFCEVLVKEFNDYHFSDLPEFSVFKKDTTLIMSKYPFIKFEYVFNVYKRLLFGKFIFNNKELYVSNIHLTSNHGTKANEKRLAQLHGLFSFVGDNSIICGDYNATNEEQLVLFENTEYKDSWIKDIDYTFAPTVNNLAKHFSGDGIDCKIDAIYFKSDLLKVKDCYIFGKEAINENLYCSDHFGIVTIFDFL